MAPRTKPATPPTEEETLQAATQILALHDDVFSAETLNPALESLYAELGMGDGGEATVHVSKLDADGRGVEAQIWKGDPDNYDLEQLAKKFGSGQYRVKVYVRIPTGQKVCKGNKVFAWMLSPEDEAKRMQVQNPQATAVKQFDPADIARVVVDSIKMALPQQNPVNSLGMLKEIAEVMRTLQPTTQQVAQTPQVDPISMMKNLAEMMVTLRGEVEPVAAGGNAGGMDVLLSLVNKFGPMFQQVMSQQQGAQMGAQAGIAAATPQLQHMPTQTQPPHQAPQQAPQQEQSGEDEVSMKLRMGLMFLVQQCKAGGLPETYAEVVLDSVPAESLAQLMSVADPVAQLAAFAPEVADHREWFEKLIGECREMLTDEPDDSGAGAGTPQPGATS